MSTRTETAEPTHEARTDMTDPEAVPPAERDAIVNARELAQQKSIERLQRWVEALEAAVAAEPVMAPSPL